MRIIIQLKVKIIFKRQKILANFLSDQFTYTVVSDISDSGITDNSAYRTKGIRSVGLSYLPHALKSAKIVNLCTDFHQSQNGLEGN